MHFVYILYSSKLDRYYCGETADIQDRLKRHNEGRSRATKAGLPWQVIKIYEVGNKSEGMKLEKTIKARGIKRHLEESWPPWQLSLFANSGKAFFEASGQICRVWRGIARSTNLSLITQTSSSTLPLSLRSFGRGLPFPKTRVVFVVPYSPSPHSARKSLLPWPT